jgi:DNA polymerase-4
MRSVLHIDANSAYLSWSAAALLEAGCPIDYRSVPSVIAGDPANRHGIILAKSIPCKEYGIGTAMSLWEAKNKCPELSVLPPDYDLYLSCSNAMYEILSEYSDKIERYSVDECFLEYTDSDSLFGSPAHAAYKIKERIKRELGFTVNIGVSVNKTLAKMGSELQKPDKVHTLYPDEIKNKMWPLPMRELFYVGRATERKLALIGMSTIGDIATADITLLKAVLKPVHGQTVYNYANGIDDSPVVPNKFIEQKGVGNSETLPYDVNTKEEARAALLALSERVGFRLRKLGAVAETISVSIRNSELAYHGHQKKLSYAIGTTAEIYQYACVVCFEIWNGDPLRQMGIHLTQLSPAGKRQMSFFDDENKEKNLLLDGVIDKIRARYGNNAIVRAPFVNTGIPAMLGGVNDGNYLMMGGYTL